jgi:hypothetical protein
LTRKPASRQLTGPFATLVLSISAYDRGAALPAKARSSLRSSTRDRWSRTAALSMLRGRLSAEVLRDLAMALLG